MNPTLNVHMFIQYDISQCFVIKFIILVVEIIKFCLIVILFHELNLNMIGRFGGLYIIFIQVFI